MITRTYALVWAGLSVIFCALFIAAARIWLVNPLLRGLDRLISAVQGRG